MKVLVTGATGFTGSYVVPQLLARDVDVRCLVRPTSDTSPLQNVELVYGDLADVPSLVAALDGMDALVNIASLGFGHADGIVAALQQASVKRAVFVSTTAIFTQLNASSKVVRMAAEQAIMDSDLDYTIIRPTMIYGSSRDRNICRLVRFVQRYPVIPVVGSGNYMQQPVYVDDVASAVVGALFTPAAIRKCYNVSGAQPLTYNQLIDTVGAAVGRNVRKLHLPLKPMTAILSTVERVITPPIKAEQLLRLNENKAFPHDEATRDFGYAPRSFADGIALEVAEMGY